MKKSYLSIQSWSWMNAVVSFDLYTKKIIKDKQLKLMNTNSINPWSGGVNKKEWSQKIKEASQTRREHLKKELNDKKGA